MMGKKRHALVIPPVPLVIPTVPLAIPTVPLVIPAEAGIQEIATALRASAAPRVLLMHFLNNV